MRRGISKYQYILTHHLSSAFLILGAWDLPWSVLRPEHKQGQVSELGHYGSLTALAAGDISFQQAAPGQVPPWGSRQGPAQRFPNHTKAWPQAGQTGYSDIRAPPTPSSASAPPFSPGRHLASPGLPGWGGGLGDFLFCFAPLKLTWYPTASCLVKQGLAGPSSQHRHHIQT